MRRVFRAAAAGGGGRLSPQKPISHVVEHGLGVEVVARRDLHDALRAERALCCCLLLLCVVKVGGGGTVGRRSEGAFRGRAGWIWGFVDKASA